MDERGPTARSTVMGAGMIAAPLLLLASTTASVAGSGLGEDQTGGVIQLYAFAAMALAVPALTRAIEPEFPRAAALLLVAGMLGVASGAGYAINAIYEGLGAVSLNDEVENAAAPLALQLPGILFPLALAGIGVARIRAGAVPRVAAWALIVAAAGFPLSRIGGIEALALVVDALLVVAMVPLGMRVIGAGGVGPATTPEGSRSAATG